VPAWLTGLRLLRGFQRDPLATLESIRAQGTMVRTRVGPRPLLVISEPAAIEAMLTSHDVFMKGRALERAKRLLGDGLLTSEGAFHLRQRRLVQPAFHRARVQGYARTMIEEADRWAARQVPGQVIDVSHAMNRLTLAIVARSLFNTDIASDADEIGRALDTVLGLFTLAVLPWTAWIDRLPLPGRFRFERAHAALDAVIFRLIAERRRDRRDRGDLLSMLLEAQDDERVGMTDQQVRDEALTLLLAGHETTANALTWTWLLLSAHPDVDRRMAEEVRCVCGTGPPTPEAMPSLTLTRMVLSEAMRLYPPAWVVGRRALVDWSVDGVAVPAGTLVTASQWLVHRDARFYPDPLRFDPDRWTPEAVASRPRFAYFPFGGGNRVCIGESFAWAEGVLALATIASRWRVALEPGQSIGTKPGITLRPDRPVLARVHPR
jgi:cytochrome P450